MDGGARSGAAILARDERAGEQGSKLLLAVCVGPIAPAQGGVAAAVQAESQRGGERSIAHRAYVLLPAGFAAVLDGCDHAGAIAGGDSFRSGRVFIAITKSIGCVMDCLFEKQGINGWVLEIFYGLSN